MWVAVIGALALGAASVPGSSAAISPHGRFAAADSAQGSPLRVRLTDVHGRQIRIVVWTTHGTERDVRLTVTRDGSPVATGRLQSADTMHRDVQLTARRGASTRGRLTVSASAIR